MSSLQVAVGVGGAASGAERDWPEVVRFVALARELGSGEDGAESGGGSDA